MVFCKLSPPCYLEFFDKEGAVSPSLHRLDLSFEGHIPSLILVPYNNVLLCLVTGYGTGDCKSILYSCDREVISRLSWTPLLGRTGLFQAIDTPYNYISVQPQLPGLICFPKDEAKGNGRKNQSLIERMSIHLHGSFSAHIHQPVWCLTWASLALIGVSFALLRNLAFRRWLLLSMFSIIRILARLTPTKICWANLCVTVSFFETGKLCSLRACHSHSADSVEEKSVSESVHATLSNVWSLRRSVHRAIPVSFIFLFFNSLIDQLAYPLKNAISCTHISERARAQIFAWVLGTGTSFTTFNTYSHF